MLFGSFWLLSDGDGVFLQQDEHAVKNEPLSQPSPHFRVHSFCKTLTASDTSTHGGFSVLRRHADECLPPLVRMNLPEAF